MEEYDNERTNEREARRDERRSPVSRYRSTDCLHFVSRGPASRIALRFDIVLSFKLSTERSFIYVAGISAAGGTALEQQLARFAIPLPRHASPAARYHPRRRSAGTTFLALARGNGCYTMRQVARRNRVHLIERCGVPNPRATRLPLTLCPFLSRSHRFSFGARETELYTL